MPRTRPRDLRRLRRHRPRWHDTPHIAGLPGDAQQEIFEIELRTAADYARSGLWPGATAEALAGWSRTSHNPAAFKAHPCDCCGRTSRQLIHEILEMLSTPSARALMQLIQPLDEEFLRRSLPDPRSPSAWPWWDRRCERRR
jgi:hypothetical protein